MSNLKPCPFCGSTDLITNNCSNNYYIECDNCGAFGPSSIDPAFSMMQREIRESITNDLWNNRAEVVAT
jgi:Lar family restriction alleviation protein